MTDFDDCAKVSLGMNKDETTNDGSNPPDTLSWLRKSGLTIMAALLERELEKRPKSTMDASSEQSGSIAVCQG